MFVVTPHDQAGQTMAEDLALLVQPRRQGPVDLVYRDLFDPALRWGRDAVGVAPRVVGGSWWSSWHGGRHLGGWLMGSRPGPAFRGVPGRDGSPAVLGGALTGCCRGCTRRRGDGAHGPLRCVDFSFRVVLARCRVLGLTKAVGVWWAQGGNVEVGW